MSFNAFKNVFFFFNLPLSINMYNYTSWGSGPTWLCRGGWPLKLLKWFFTIINFYYSFVGNRLVRIEEWLPLLLYISRVCFHLSASDTLSVTKKLKNLVFTRNINPSQHTFTKLNVVNSFNFWYREASIDLQTSMDLLRFLSGIIYLRNSLHNETHLPKSSLASLCCFLHLARLFLNQTWFRETLNIVSSCHH